MKCQRCGFINQQKGRYCGKCAQPFFDDYQQKKLKIMLIMMAVGGGVGILFFVFAFIAILIKLLAGK